MKRLAQLASLSALAFALANTNLAAQETGWPAKGLSIARQICSECHAIDKSQLASPNPASPRFVAIANSKGITALALTVALRTSHREMPNLILETDDLRDVIAYIISLK
jgi:mono/diheme cytochrome c family protein